jgi:prepilin-type N-terminal cleavage/methylation domain-containing protein/prepilin-type processing-associated H-X9-DG protein
MINRPPKPVRPAPPNAFTLVELLVVIGLIGVLMSLLLPSIGRARQQATTVACASNIRQLCLGLIGYAAENKGHFPPNVHFNDPGQFWYYDVRVGGYLAPEGIRKGLVFACPADLDGRRSYAMNAWTSCKLDGYVLQQVPTPGVLWGCPPRDGSRVMLILETWSFTQNPTRGWDAPDVIGWYGDTPGQRFGGLGGLAPPADAGRWGKVPSQIVFSRHRAAGLGASVIDPIGCTNIGYADGHVDLKMSDQLVKPSGKSTLDSLWSPLDEQQNQ